MLGITQLDKALTARLDPLRKALQQERISVAGLPKDAGKYSHEEVGTVRVLAPTVRNAGGRDGIYEYVYTVVVSISLNKRYADDPKEKATLEWVAEEIHTLFYEFNPFDGSDRPKNNLSLQDYNLFKPAGGQWQAEMIFTCSKTVSGSPLPNENYDTLAIALFNSLNNNHTLIKLFPASNG